MIAIADPTVSTLYLTVFQDSLMPQAGTGIVVRISKSVYYGKSEDIARTEK